MFREQIHIPEHKLLTAICANHHRQTGRNHFRICPICAPGKPAPLSAGFQLDPVPALPRFRREIKRKRTIPLRFTARKEGVYPRAVRPQRYLKRTFEQEGGTSGCQTSPSQILGTREGVEIRIQRKNCPVGHFSGNRIKTPALCFYI